MQKSGLRNPWGTKLVREAKKLVPTGSQSRAVGAEGYKLVCRGTPGEMVAGSYAEPKVGTHRAKKLVQRVHRSKSWSAGVGRVSPRVLGTGKMAAV